MWTRVYRLDDGQDMLVDDGSETMRDAEKAHLMDMRAVDDLGFICVRGSGEIPIYLNLNHVIYVTFEESDVR